MESNMTPRFRSITEALKKLQHNLDSDAQKLMQRIETADSRRETVFARSHATVAAAHTQLDDVDNFINELERSNQGPLEQDSAPAPRSSEVSLGLRQVK
jgi:hypothetical protein